jgi:hypothetical protein
MIASVEESNTRLVRLTLIFNDSVIEDKWPSNSRFNIRYWQRIRKSFKNTHQESEWLFKRLVASIIARREYLKRQHQSTINIYEPQSSTHNSEVNQLAFTMTENVFLTRELSDLCSTQGWNSFDESIKSRFNHIYNAKIKMQADGFPIICPYCRTQIMISNQKQWERHVSTDLKPYMCTFKECNWRMFSNCDDWFSHELQYHRREWVCQQCRVDPFSSSLLSTHTSHRNIVWFCLALIKLV